jgi:type I restriction enzyme M protein
MSKRITIEELESYLWQSAVLLRSNIDAGAYKQYIFPLLFFKRICDVYDEETDIATEQYGEDISAFSEDELHMMKSYYERILDNLKNKLEEEKED